MVPAPGLHVDFQILICMWNNQFAIMDAVSHTQGNLLFTSDGGSIISPLGNRVGVFDLVKCVGFLLGCFASWWLIFAPLHSNKSRTLPFENRKNIARIALSPDAHILVSVDEGEKCMHSLSSLSSTY